MESDPDLPPPLPLTSPVLDPQGRLTYVGSDGRRYVVLGPGDQEDHRRQVLEQRFDQGRRVFEQIDRQAHLWLDLVCAPDLPRAEAVALLLQRLDNSLSGEGDGPPPAV